MSQPRRSVLLLAALAARGLYVATEGLALAVEPTTLAAGAAAVPTRIQVYREGQYVGHPQGKFQLTPQIFEEMVRNHALMGSDPPVDREHETTLSVEPQDARGWVKGLSVGDDPKRAGKKGLFADIDWTPPGASEVGQRLYRYVSGGCYFNAKDRETGKPMGAVLDHIAICKKPFITGMEPLTNSAGAAGHEENDMNHLRELIIRLTGAKADADEAVLLAALEPHNDKIQAVIAGKAAVLISPPALAKLGLSSSATAAEVDAAIVTLAGKAEVATKLEATVADLALKDVTREVDEAVATFKVTPGERDAMLTLAKTNRELFRQLVAARPAQAPGGKVQLAARPVASTLIAEQMKAINAHLAAHPEENPDAALIACARANPALFAAGEV